MLGFLVDNVYVQSLETRSSSSNNPLAFLWALIVLLYRPVRSYVDTSDHYVDPSDHYVDQSLSAPLLADLFLYSYEDNNKILAMSFNHTFRYIDDVLSINNHNFHNYAT
jgi:hypothetical protein